MGLENPVPFQEKVLQNYRSKVKYMKKKSFIIQYLLKYTEEDEKTIRKNLKDFWKKYPEKGLDGNCGFILNERRENRDPKEIAQEVLRDVQNKEIQDKPPFTQRYWVVMTDKYRLRRP